MTKRINSTSKITRPSQTQTSEVPQKRGRGRPRKQRTPEELALIEQKKQRKITLAERQAMKLKAQREKQAAKAAAGFGEPGNKDRFYCTSKELTEELIKWRDSAKEVTDRVVTNKLGEMLMSIGNKLLNHSSFRNYPKELKEDMLMFGLEKLIKGLKNYNFEFNNSFAYCTQVFWNAYLTIINKHYKQLNIKKDLMKKLSSELETYQGISTSSALSKCIKTYLGEDVSLD